LAALRERIAFPATPALAPAVLAGIARAGSEPASIRRPPATRRWLLAAALALIAIGAALGFSRDLRSAVADLFGVPGIRIEIERDTPTPKATSAPATPPAGATLLFGEPVGLAQAQALAPFHVGVPVSVSLGEPDEIYLRTLPDGNVMVSLAYLPDAGLPETEGTGIAVLLMQFEQREDVDYLVKLVSQGRGAISTSVGDHRAFWIIGSHQLVLLSDPSRGCCDGFSRTAGNVLLWEADGVTYRLESALPLAEAKAIAESIVYPGTPVGN
jgi:hypothetical protein